MAQRGGGAANSKPQFGRLGGSFPQASLGRPAARSLARRTQWAKLAVELARWLSCGQSASRPVGQSVAQSAGQLAPASRPIHHRAQKTRRRAHIIVFASRAASSSFDWPPVWLAERASLAGARAQFIAPLHTVSSAADETPSSLLGRGAKTPSAERPKLIQFYFIARVQLAGGGDFCRSLARRPLGAARREPTKRHIQHF